MTIFTVVYLLDPKFAVLLNGNHKNVSLKHFPPPLFFAPLKSIKRWLRWPGHVLRMSPERIPKVALWWTPGKRKRERPKTTWKKRVETELNEMGSSW